MFSTRGGARVRGAAVLLLITLVFMGGTHAAWQIGLDPITQMIRPFLLLVLLSVLQHAWFDWPRRCPGVGVQGGAVGPEPFMMINGRHINEQRSRVSHLV